jgi:acyl carrier protein
VGLHAVERVLDEMDGVAKSVVVPSVDEQGGQPDGLIAYIVGRDGKPSASLLARIRRQARIELPAYAVPAHFIGLAALPMREGESRKLDKRALPAPEHHADTSLEPARLSDIERRIGNVWREVLGIEWVQPADNFFDLGGNSLSAARLVGTLAERYGISLAVVDVYQYSTLQAMAERCRGIERGQDATRRQRPVGSSKVAVIGMAGRFPGAGSLDEFWANLRDGHDALRTFSRDELKARGLSDEVLEHPNWVCAGQVLDDADKFDAAFFGIGQREAALMDPQHRLFMEIAWAAMEQAGYARSDNPYRDRTAVYAACGIDGYLVHHLNGGGLREPLDPGKLFLTEIGNEKDYIATRVAYRLDLGGPAVTVTSACSSGLVAVAQAAQALMSG